MRRQFTLELLAYFLEDTSRTFNILCLHDVHKRVVHKRTDRGEMRQGRKDRYGGKVERGGRMLIREMS